VDVSVPEFLREFDISDGLALPGEGFLDAVRRLVTARATRTSVGLPLAKFGSGLLSFVALAVTGAVSGGVLAAPSVYDDPRVVVGVGGSSSTASTASVRGPSTRSPRRSRPASPASCPCSSAWRSSTASPGSTPVTPPPSWGTTGRTESARRAMADTGVPRTRAVNRYSLSVTRSGPPRIGPPSAVGGGATPPAGGRSVRGRGPARGTDRGTAVPIPQRVDADHREQVPGPEVDERKYDTQAERPEDVDGERQRCPPDEPCGDVNRREPRQDDEERRPEGRSVDRSRTASRRGSPAREVARGSTPPRLARSRRTPGRGISSSRRRPAPATTARTSPFRPAGRPPHRRSGGRPTAIPGGREEASEH